MAEQQESNSLWERKLLENLATESLREQRRRRRWGIFFKLAALAYFSVLLLILVDWQGTTEKFADGKTFTALVQLNGVIKADGQASAEKINASMRAAFKDPGTRGVILRINSPGGSPVQSGMINDEIHRLRALHPSIPLYAVIEDIGASGGYYVAVAADRIYVDKASLLGSIGVLMDGFGFTGSMEKLGVERRLLTAGENKGFLDPFSPENAEQTALAQSMIDEIHQQFVDVVRSGRGKRLKESPELYSGLVWTGVKAIELGLADELGSIDSVARDVIKAEDIRDFTERTSLSERFARQFGADMTESVLGALEKIRFR